MFFPRKRSMDTKTSQKFILRGTEGSSGASTWLIFGSTGWIGGQLIELLNQIKKSEYTHPSIGKWKFPIGSVVKAVSRIQNREDVANELDKVNPTYVINCAGLTGRPNVDWCESNKEAVIRVNVIGTLNLIDLCSTRGIHLTNFATGCIYQYDEKHSMGSGIGFQEDDEPNFHGSFYSYTKAMVDNLVRNYDNVLTLRLRMPISDDLSPRSFITKISKYEKVVNIPNSMTVLWDLLPVGLHMTASELKGVFNFTNPGTISHNQILDLYTVHIDPAFRYHNFTVEEQDLILKAERSNNELDVNKILSYYPNIPIVTISMVDVFKRMKENL
jgi:3,5-epimerase/4-reductase